MEFLPLTLRSLSHGLRRTILTMLSVSMSLSLALRLLPLRRGGAILFLSCAQFSRATSFLR